MRAGNNAVWLVCVALCLSVGTVLATLQSRYQHSPTGQEQIDLTKFPVVDSTSPLPSNPQERAKRQAKSKKYNGKHSRAISEATDQIFHLSDWDAGLPALPVAKSDAVVIGEITDARAYLSDDQTDIYSEFSVRIDEVLKNDTQNPIQSGAQILIERKGGRVRLPSGKIAVSIVNHQDMPRVGKRYVLFLTHSFPLGGQIEDFYLLTGYEFRAGRVFPLDKIPVGHPITAYKGSDETSFLTDLRAAVRPFSNSRAKITRTVVIPIEDGHKEQHH